MSGAAYAAVAAVGATGHPAVRRAVLPLIPHPASRPLRAYRTSTIDMSNILFVLYLLSMV
jgi:hypothetical protein